MNPTRRQPQYLEIRLLTPFNDHVSASVQSARRSWWLIISLVVLVAFFFSLAFAA